MAKRPPPRPRAPAHKTAAPARAAGAPARRTGAPRLGPSGLLEAAATLVAEVLRPDAPADAKVSAFFRQHRHLGPRERHALAETTYAVLRLRLRLEAQAADAPPEPVAPLPRRLCILAWQGSEDFLQAALSPEERSWRQRVLQAARAAGPDALPAPQRHNLPPWLAQALQAQLGEEAFWPLADALLQPAPLDLRVNTLKARREEVLRALADAGLHAEPTPHSPWGLRLQGKPALQKLALFTDGLVEVQDEGSQLLAALVDARRGEMVVDFCAGAGGKTLALGAAMRSTGRLYAFDVSAHRLEALKPRLARSGLSNVHPVQIAHERDERVKRLAGKIDRVLVDAPCTGLGTLRRNPDLKWRHTPAAVAELQQLQGAILASAARLPKPGGRLVYATCSLLREENEAVAEAFEASAGRAWKRLDAGALLAAAQVGGAAELAEAGALRLWPHRQGTDGFYACVWQRIA